MLHWQVSGSNSRLAADMLGDARLDKQAQLLQFALGRTDESQLVGDLMRRWKRSPHGVEFESWHEVAGFVDAEACCAAARHSMELRSLNGTQVWPEACSLT